MTGQKESQAKGQGPFCGDDEMGCGLRGKCPAAGQGDIWGGLAGVDRRPLIQPDLESGLDA